MNPRLPSPPSRLALLLTGVLCLGAPLAAAQYRPPPMSEAQRFTREGEEARVEAGKAAAAKDQARARERLQRAISLYQQALKAEPNHVLAAGGLGLAALELGEYDRVLNEVWPALKASPNEVELAYPVAVALYKLRRFDEAVPLFEQVSKANQAEHLLAHYYYGSWAIYAGKGELAVREFGRYLGQRPPALAGNDFQFHELTGRGYLLQRDVGRARASFQKAQAGRPESPTIQMGLSACLELEGKQEEAKQLLAGLVSRFPKQPEPMERLARLHLQDGELAKAEPLAAKLLALGDSPTARLLSGDVRTVRKAHGEAEKDYRRALELAPGWVAAQIALGGALQNQAKHEEAISSLEQAVKGGASSVELWANLGTVNRRAGRFQRAVEVHRRVIDMAPEQALGYVLLGADHYATGQWDLAIEDYETALQKEPTHAGAKHWLAMSLAQRARGRAEANRIQDAARDLRRAFDLERSAPMARRLGAALLSQSKFDEAAKVLTHGVTQKGAGWREHFLLGYAHLGARDAAQALPSFERAASFTSNPEQQAEIYAGWALAKLELGEFDAAIAKLQELGDSKAVSELSEANLPTALLRRALAQLERGQSAPALKDVQAAERAGRKNKDVVKLAAYARALAAIEDGEFRSATALARKALVPAPKWARSNTRQLVEAYAQYRSGAFPRARKSLRALERRPLDGQKAWLAGLERAIDVREGEVAYAKGNLKVAERQFRAVLKANPLNPLFQNNVACVEHRKGRSKAAIEIWERLAGGLPTASLNLGIDAQERAQKYPEAVSHYARYIASGSGRAGTVKQWKERLQAIWDIPEPQLDEAGAQNVDLAQEGTP